jgi:CRP/FNR family cyclic AMP-dependent transcriptional regulator
MATAVSTRGNNTLTGIDSPFHASPLLKEPPSTTQDLPPTLQEGCPELSRIPLFSKLPAEGLRQISIYGVARSYPKNAILIHEKDQGESLYVILSGKVKIYVSNEEGKKIILNVLNPGEYFGELELIDTGPYSAPVMTLEQSQIYMISRAGLHYYLSKYPTIAFEELLHSLALRIRLLTESVKSFALDNVYQRVIRTLLNLATERDGTLVIEQRFTQQDVMDRVGASREMVSLILRGLNAGGYIKIKDRKITIQRKLPPDW